MQVFTVCTCLSICVATGSTRLPSYSSPPTTPGGMLASSCDSESDSGNPSSPDSNVSATAIVSATICFIHIMFY